jgi:hypothetical protein
MNYTAKQIETAKSKYNSFLKLESFSDYNLDVLTKNEAGQRMEDHNAIVTEILNGNIVLEAKWKTFFLHEVAKADQKSNESKAKLAANKESSSDILAPIKAAKRVGEFGKWLNTAGNQFRKEHFNKKYTQESVNAFLSI